MSAASASILALLVAALGAALLVLHTFGQHKAINEKMLDVYRETLLEGRKHRPPPEPAPPPDRD